MTRAEWEARWKLWRWDRQQPFEERTEHGPGILWLESKEWAAKDEKVEVPMWTLFVRFDECSHLHATIASPDVEAAFGGRPADTIGNYMHICGARQYDSLIALLSEAKTIAHEWYAGYAGFWE